MKIYLVGMPGSGKSTLGSQLADVFNLDFIDLDKEIEKKEQRVISQIFSEEGEDYFRIKEAEMLRELAGGNENFVLATGGGAPCFYKGMELLNETGLTIFLDVEVAELIRRLKKKTDRPLLENQNLEKKLALLLETRNPIYSQASLIIRQPNLQKIVDGIKRKIQ